MTSSNATNAPNHALQRTPGFGVQLPSAAVVRPAQSRAVLPAMKPGTARAFALRRRAHGRAPGPESLSLGSLGVTTRVLWRADLSIIFLTAVSASPGLSSTLPLPPASALTPASAQCVTF